MSRRWQTYAARTGFVFLALLATLIVWALFVNTESDVAKLGRAGRQIFGTYEVTLFLAVALMAPLMVSSGISEERDERTLDLLTMTGIHANQVLYGKLGSRLLGLCVLVLSGMPILSCALSLGGISVWEVVNVTVNGILLALLLGSIAGFTALLTRNTVIPAIAAWSWLAISTFSQGLVFLFGSNGADLFASMHVAGAMHEDSALGLLPVLFYLPSMVMVAWLAPIIYRIVTTGDDEEEFGLISSDVWALERYRVRTWLLATIVVVGVVVLAGALLSAPWLWQRLPQFPVVWGSWCILVMLLTRVYLLALMSLAGMVKRMQAQYRQKREGVVGDASRVWVWPLPIAWREVRPGGNWVLGRLNQVLLLLYVLMLAGMVSMGAYGDSEVHISVQVVAFIVALGATAVLTIQSVVDERQRRTLPVLLTTTHPVPRMLLGYYLAVLYRVWPWIGIGMLAWWTARPQVSDWNDLSFRIARIEHMGITLLWFLGVLTVLFLVTRLLASRIRPARAAWGLLGVYVMMVTMGPGVLMILIELTLGEEVLRALIGWMFPMFERAGLQRFTKLFIVTVGWWTAALVLARVLVTRFRSWAVR